MTTTPLVTPILDPRNEVDLVEAGLARVFTASGGRLNDFTPSSTARALIEGQAFAAAELLYYVNQLPLALAIEYLKIAGVERSLGVAAIATLTFSLTSPLATPFSIPAGFTVATAGGLIFATDTLLIIPAGAISGDVTATCQSLGIAGNVPAFSITRVQQPLSFLGSCTNVQPAEGGTEAETVNAVIARGLTAIRRRNIVTREDYELEAQTILGEGSRAHAIGLLAGDKISYQLGAVHLFALNASGDVPNNAQIAAVSSGVGDRIQIGTSLYVSAIDLLNIDVDVVARLQVGADPVAAAETLWQAIQDYLAPTQFTAGASIILKEVEYVLRLTGTLEFIQAVTLNGAATNLPMPYPYSLPRPHSVFLTLLDSSGTQYQILRGAGEDYV